MFHSNQWLASENFWYARKQNILESVFAQASSSIEIHSKGKAVKASERGQALALAVLCLPLFLLVATLIYYFAQTGNIQASAQAICRKAVLEGVSVQAKGLASLAKINTTALGLAQAHRALTVAAVAAAVTTPALAAEAIIAAQRISKLQEGVERIQNVILKSIPIASKRASDLILKQLKSAQVIKQSPAFPNGPHVLPTSLRLHVQKIPQYQNMRGAPLELDPDFKSRQQLSLRLRTNSKGLKQLMRIAAPAPIVVECSAHVKMKTLEEVWKVELGTNVDKLLSN